MSNKRISRIVSIAFTLVAFVFSTLSALAVGVKPLRTELVIDPGSEVTSQLMVINSEDKELTLRPEVQVYVRNDESGFPVAIDLEDNDPRNIAKWISFEDQELTLKPTESKKVNFTVVVPEGAEPGGRYASIVYTPMDEGDGTNVQVQARVASLILIKVTGEEIITGEVSSFGVKDEKIYSDRGVILGASFNNTGNVHLKPKGEVVIKNESGEQVLQVARYKDKSGSEVVADTIPINVSEGNVLPGSERTFDAVWTDNITEGKFTAEMELAYGGEESIQQTAEIKIEEEVKIDSFEIVQTPESASFKFTATNNGNVYEKLVGGVEVKNNFGMVIANPEIPSETDYLAPGESKTIEIPWLDKALEEGKYSATLKIDYGLTKKNLEKEINFGEAKLDVAMIAAIGGGALVVILIIVLIVVLLKRKKGGASAESIEEAVEEALKKEHEAEAKTKEDEEEEK